MLRVNATDVTVIAMTDSLSWDDVPDSGRKSHQNYGQPQEVKDFIPPEDYAQPVYKGGSLLDTYDAAWLEWFVIERRGDGHHGQCQICPEEKHYRGQGSKYRVRDYMEKHCYAEHIESTLTRTLGARQVETYRTRAHALGHRPGNAPRRDASTADSDGDCPF